MFGDNNSVFHGSVYRLAAYNIVTDAPDIDYNNPRVQRMLQYFQVNPAMILQYVLANWPLFGAVRDDMIYDHVAEEIFSRRGIFIVPEVENLPATQDYFYEFETLMEVIYRFRDACMATLKGAIDVSNEADATTLHCLTYKPDHVAIRVEPAYEY